MIKTTTFEMTVKDEKFMVNIGEGRLKLEVIGDPDSIRDLQITIAKYMEDSRGGRLFINKL